MAKHLIQLEVTFRAIHIGDEYAPGETTVEDSVTLSMPSLDPKFVIFPKILEGMTLAVIERHRALVRSYYGRRESEEQVAEEQRQMDLFVAVGAGGCEEGATCLHYEEWLGSQPWPDDAVCATLGKDGSCCWWVGDPELAEEEDLGWVGELAERYFDVAMPFVADAPWQESLRTKAEVMAGLEGEGEVGQEEKVDEEAPIEETMETEPA